MSFDKDFWERIPVIVPILQQIQFQFVQCISNFGYANDIFYLVSIPLELWHYFSHHNFHCLPQHWWYFFINPFPHKYFHLFVQNFKPLLDDAFVYLNNVISIVYVVDKRIQSNPEMVDAVVLETVSECCCDLFIPEEGLWVLFDDFVNERHLITILYDFVNAIFEDGWKFLPYLNNNGSLRVPFF